MPMDYFDSAIWPDRHFVEQTWSAMQQVSAL
jgi:hypothetical protein